MEGVAGLFCVGVALGLALAVCVSGPVRAVSKSGCRRALRLPPALGFLRRPAGYYKGRCPEHGVVYPCPVPISGHWSIEDGDEGWYVVRPYDWGRVGPFSEDEASRQLPILRERYPLGGYFD